MKKILLTIMASAGLLLAHAQLMINTTDVPVLIDFTGFAGAGFQPGGGAGMLNSNEWSVTGFSEGAVDFGATATTGDFARGSTMGLVTSGGVYGVDIAGNQGLMVQPTADDFTPGSFILKIENNTGVDVTEIAIAYTIYVLNDQNRSNSFNLSVSYDNITYTPITAVDYTSPDVMDFTPYVVPKATNITGLDFPDGTVMYLSWTGDDVGGAGSRDEFALDDVSITAIEGAPVSLATFAPAADVVDETAGTASVNISLSDNADCTVHVSMNAASTADGADATFAAFDHTFDIAGDPLYTFNIPLTDDLLDEPDETLILDLTYIAGACAVGLPSTFTLLIMDDDVTPPPTYTVYDIAEIHGEDANGVATSIDAHAEITGVVHGINTWNGGLQFTLIDATDGISVFSYDNDFGYTVTEGDEITIQGVVTQFNGLTEIEPDTLWFIDGGNALETSSIVTTLSEATESHMTTITNLSYVDVAEWLGDGSSFNVNLTNGVNTYTIRIDDNNELSTMTAPSLGTPYTLSITGIGGQYDTGSPYLDGYQLNPRYAADIVVVPTVGIYAPEQYAIAVYPNPVIDACTITANELINSIRVINALGQVVYSASVNANHVSLQTGDWNAGLYQIQLDINGNLSNTQVVVE